MIEADCAAPAGVSLQMNDMLNLMQIRSNLSVFSLAEACQKTRSSRWFATRSSLLQLTRSARR